MDEYLGIIKLFAGNFVPVNYLMCNGALLSIAQNSALFSLLGTTYGGDGVNTFALPDLRGQVAVGAGQSRRTGTPYIEGQVAGTEATTLTVANMPPHTHKSTLNINTATPTLSAPVAGVNLGVPGVQSGRDFVPDLAYTTAAPNLALGDDTVTVTATGGGQAISNMQPFLVLNYIICVNGIYPSRP